MFEHYPGAKLFVPKSLRVFSAVSLVGVAILLRFRIRLAIGMMLGGA
jgi:hypothetical protein